MISTRPPQLVSAEWEERNGVKVYVERFEAVSTIEEVELIKEMRNADHDHIVARKTEVEALNVEAVRAEVEALKEAPVIVAE